MTDDSKPDPMRHSETPRKPRLALMGEFSAGKSTLSNILLGSVPLPMRVTATRLPPVHLSYGEPTAYAVGKDGNQIPFDLSDWESVSLDETQSIHLTMEADTLQLCDLVDMPGISDPNMPKDIWESVVGEADHVVWCTHATQAWRQSEAAIWEMLQESTSGKNLLLITQFDKLRNDRDRARVLKRVKKETDGLFSAVYPISLLEALNAEEDFETWKTSGAAAFSEHLIEILLASGTHESQPDAGPELREPLNPGSEAFEAESEPEVSAPVDFAQKKTEAVISDEDDQSATPQLPDALPNCRVIPRRVQMKSGGASRERLDRRATVDAEGL